MALRLFAQETPDTEDTEDNNRGGESRCDQRHRDRRGRRCGGGQEQPRPRGRDRRRGRVCALSPSAALIRCSDPVAELDNLRIDHVHVNEGRISLYYGSASGVTTASAWVTESGQLGAHFGQAVAGAGDVNGDGFADIIVGADEYTNNEIDEGRAFVFYGSGRGIAETPACTTTGPLVGSVQPNVPSFIKELSEAGERDHLPPPMLGEHTESVLRERLGVDDETLRRLRESGVFGS